MLLFKKKFIAQIKSGEKTQTIRLWKYCRMRAGQKSYIAGIGYVRIDSIERIELASLTDADAMLDGFPSADELRSELCALYGADVLAKLRTYKIRFSVYPPCKQKIIMEERRKVREQRAILKKSYRNFNF